MHVYTRTRVYLHVYKVYTCFLFFFRVCLSVLQSASVGGAAHLVNFKGTDTIASLIMARDYYGSKSVAGLSIPAAEHSTITSWTKDGEFDAFKNMLTKVTSLLSCP